MKMVALLAASTLLAAPALAQAQSGHKPGPAAHHPTTAAAPVKTVTGKESNVKPEHAKRETPSKPRAKR